MKIPLFQRIVARYARILSQLVHVTRHVRIQGAAPFPRVQEATGSIFLQFGQVGRTGQTLLLQGCTIFSRAMLPHSQDVYIIYPPVHGEEAYTTELREVTFTKDATGLYVPNFGRPGKHRQAFATYAELAQAFNIESHDWQVIREPARM